MHNWSIQQDFLKGIEGLVKVNGYNFVKLKRFEPDNGAADSRHSITFDHPGRVESLTICSYFFLDVFKRLRYQSNSRIKKGDRTKTI